MLCVPSGSVPSKGYSRGTVSQEEGEDTDPEVREDFKELDGEDTLDPDREESREADDGYLRDNHIMTREPQPSFSIFL